MTPSSIPIREFFSIGDVCELTDLKPHVLRYWESQFKFLHPAKNRSGNRVYQRREVELIMLVKQLLYVEKYTIDGARQRVDEYRKAGELKALARAALDAQSVASLQRELTAILAILDGRTPEPPDDVIPELPDDEPSENGTGDGSGNGTGNGARPRG